jgi:hypothetical protein
VNDLLAALEPVVDAFAALGIRYRIGGSVASTLLGTPRSTLDVDVVCDIEDHHVSAFVNLLAAAYYVDDAMIRDAIHRRASFNLIHLTTMLKVDIFVKKNRPFDATSFARSTPASLDAGGRVFDVTTAEDIIIHKLEWYRLGGEVSDRQWSDVLGVLRVQSDAIDLDYLRQWADPVGVRDLLEKALSER